jgi:hypothetical protein
MRDWYLLTGVKPFMSLLTIALLQMTACGNDQDANRSKGEAFCRRARDMGADIALFPPPSVEADDLLGRQVPPIGHELKVCPGDGELHEAARWSRPHASVE